MKLIQSTGNSWIGCNDKTFCGCEKEILKYLKEKTLEAQVWFFDLDENHAFPAKEIVKKAIGTKKSSPQYISWCLQAMFYSAIKGKKAESKLWKKYVNNFLRRCSSRDEIKRIFTTRKALWSLHSGVQEFCSRVSKAKRYYVTRNIEEIASVYSSALKFDGYFAEADKKYLIAEQFIITNPEVNFYGIDGDSEEDGEIIDVIKHYNKSLISFYSCKNQKNIDDRFDFFTSRDRTALVELLKN